MNSNWMIALRLSSSSFSSLSRKIVPLGTRWFTFRLKRSHCAINVGFGDGFVLDASIAIREAANLSFHASWLRL
jgi:hypothetical protein